MKNKTIKKRKEWTAPGEKAYNLGKPIKDVYELEKLVKEKRAVYLTNLRRHQPAAVVIRMQCYQLLRLIENGKLIIINKKNEANKK